jgi:hypothetical protein
MIFIISYYKAWKAKALLRRKVQVAPIQDKLMNFLYDYLHRRVFWLVEGAVDGSC